MGGFDSAAEPTHAGGGGTHNPQGRVRPRLHDLDPGLEPLATSSGRHTPHGGHHGGPGAHPSGTVSRSYDDPGGAGAISWPEHGPGPEPRKGLKGALPRPLKAGGVPSWRDDTLHHSQHSGATSYGGGDDPHDPRDRGFRTEFLPYHELRRRAKDREVRTMGAPAATGGLGASAAAAKSRGAYGSSEGLGLHPRGSHGDAAMGRRAGGGGRGPSRDGGGAASEVGGYSPFLEKYTYSGIFANAGGPGAGPGGGGGGSAGGPRAYGAPGKSNHPSQWTSSEQGRGGRADAGQHAAGRRASTSQQGLRNNGAGGGEPVVGARGGTRPNTMASRHDGGGAGGGGGGHHYGVSMTQQGGAAPPKEIQEILRGLKPGHPMHITPPSRAPAGAADHHGPGEGEASSRRWSHDSGAPGEMGMTGLRGAGGAGRPGDPKRSTTGELMGAEYIDPPSMLGCHSANLGPRPGTTGARERGDGGGNSGSKAGDRNGGGDYASSSSAEHLASTSFDERPRGGGHVFHGIGGPSGYGDGDAEGGVAGASAERQECFTPRELDSLAASLDGGGGSGGRGNPNQRLPGGGGASSDRPGAGRRLSAGGGGAAGEAAAAAAGSSAKGGRRSSAVGAGKKGGLASASGSKSKPSSHGKPKGELIFNGNFEGGNIGEVKQVTDCEWEVNLRPDTLAARYRLWFHWRVSNCKAGQRALISICNFSKTRSLYRDGMSPLVKSTSRPTWERVPCKNVFYFRSPRHKMAYVLSFVFVFDREDDVYSFAYSYPFSYTEQQRLLADLQMRQLPYIQRNLLCRSVQGRRVDVITIADPLPPAPQAQPAPARSHLYDWDTFPRPPPNEEPEARREGVRKVVFISARVHPGETPASWVLRGFLDFVTGDSEDAARLRKEVVIVVVPMLNPDGTFLGNYRTCSLGTDLNRMWANPSVATEPSLLYTKNLILQYAGDPRFELDFYIDVHAHSTARQAFFLCNPPPQPADVNAYDRVTALPRIYEANDKDFSLAACRFCSEPSKAGSARRAMRPHLPKTFCYTLEVSFFGDTNGGGQSCTQDSYMNTGLQLAISLIDFYNIPRKDGPNPPPPSSDHVSTTAGSTSRRASRQGARGAGRSEGHGGSGSGGSGGSGGGGGVEPGSPAAPASPVGSLSAASGLYHGASSPGPSHAETEAFYGLAETNPNVSGGMGAPGPASPPGGGGGGEALGGVGSPPGGVLGLPTWSGRDPLLTDSSEEEDDDEDDGGDDDDDDDDDDAWGGGGSEDEDGDAGEKDNVGGLEEGEEGDGAALDAERAASQALFAASQQVAEADTGSPRGMAGGDDWGGDGL